MSTEDVFITDSAFVDENSQSQFGAVYIGFISAIGLLFNVLVMMVIIVLKDYKKTTNW